MVTQTPPTTTHSQNKPDYRYKNRIIGLDILRVLFALIIFFFHSRVHLGCEFGVLNDFFKTPMIGMTGFFMLSGYALMVAYGNKNMWEKSSIVLFYKKRFASVYPLYFVVGFFAVLMYIIAGVQKITDNIVLIPVELLGIQSFFNEAFFLFSHNSGTWFVSCILFCYLLFPFIKEGVSSFTVKSEVFFTLFFILLLSYIHFLPKYFDCGDIYTNPFVRLLEFVLGVVIASFNVNQSEKLKILKIIQSWYMVLISSVLLVVCCSLSTPFKYLLMYFCLTVVFLTMGMEKNSGNQKNYGILLYASKISYAFFLGQFFVWNPLKFIQLKVGAFSNVTKITVSFVLCCVISIILYEFVEKRLGDIVKKKLLYAHRKEDVSR